MSDPDQIRVVLDWRNHRVSDRPKRCRSCNDWALMQDAQGRPQHKMCAEKEATRAAIAAARAYQLGEAA